MNRRWCDPSTNQSPPVWPIDLSITAGVTHRLSNHRRCDPSTNQSPPVWSIDLWITAGEEYLNQEMVDSISMFYPSKLAFCNFIQLEKWSVECSASFLFLYPKDHWSISMFYPSKLAFSNFIQLEKRSVECGASFLVLYQKMSTVFLCFTNRNWGSVSSFN